VALGRVLRRLLASFEIMWIYVHLENHTQPSLALQSSCHYNVQYPNEYSASAPWTSTDVHVY